VEQKELNNHTPVAAQIVLDTTGITDIGRMSLALKTAVVVVARVVMI